MTGAIDQDVLERVQRRLAEEPETPEPARLAAIVREEAVVISDLDVLGILRTLRDHTAGTGPLEAVLASADVTDVCVNGPDAVYVDRGRGLERSDVTFSSEAEVRRLAARLATSCGRRLDDAHPYCDGHILRPDGHILRFHALLAPTAHVGTCISLRVLRGNTTTLTQLETDGSIAVECGKLLRRIIRERASFLVIGGTGAGKTTLLSAMLAEVSHHERIIAIEDTVELAPAHPHVVNLTTRGNNAEGVGEISIANLVRQALRMRPDRIVIGEIRGGEVVDLLAALNTGHDGGAGTLHANSVYEVPARMEALAALGGMDRAGLHSQLAAAVDYVIVVKRLADGSRRVHQIAALEGNPVRVRLTWEDEP
ncbi:TadA family conjugal transfer-associated ATPase [Corynebacterium mayonis]|uniref:TadA family conjugal transfer-associated ATPase n=1 Tax=Corynebacterium mayonis TaxID=3062461 RepID=UPI00313FE450